jgi:nuclear pore complex protein Nup54
MQTQLLHRIAKLCSHLHLLIPVLRASAIRPEEEGLRAALDSLSQEIRGTTASSGDRQQIGRLRARLNELWALLGAAQAARGRGATKDGRWAVVDEDGLRELAQVCFSVFRLHRWALNIVPCRFWAINKRVSHT